MRYELTPPQARRFMLEKQGLWGEYRFRGTDGVAAFARQAGCVQFDPVDVCGRSADLTFLSRVEDYQKSLLDTALYQERRLLDYWDKNMAILPMEEWPYLESTRRRYREEGRSREKVEAVREHLLGELRTRGPLCARDLDYGKDTSWYWSSTTVARAALETLFFRGELCVHHKKNGIKHYDLAERCVPKEILDSHPEEMSEEDELKRRILRRVGGVGLLWNRASDAWLCIDGMNAQRRSAAFSALLTEKKLIAIDVQGLRDTLYALAEDEPTLARAAAWNGENAPLRCELIAPLDSFLWDRKLISALFGFSYTWEIYTVPEKRRYGYYVLPILLGERLAGRIETVRDSKCGLLRVKGLWWEDGVKPARGEKEALRGALRRLAAMNGVKTEPGIRL